MPLYNYKCTKCGEEFDQNRKISERESTVCKCGGVALKELSAPRGIKNGYCDQGKMFVR